MATYNQNINNLSDTIDLSIIIPAYNVENYVKVCLETIYKQELNEDCFEVIVVNDGSKDRTADVIREFAVQHTNLLLINQENQGVSATRNNAISRARGKYILMVDSDDFLLENSIKPLLAKALEYNADIIMADYVEIHDKDISSTKLPTLPQKLIFEVKNAEEQYMKDLASPTCYVVRSLFRRRFIIDNKIKFISGITYEDIPFTHECYMKAKKCLRIYWPFYVYRIDRPSSITYSFNSKKAEDMCLAIGYSWKLTYLQGISSQMRKKLQNNVFAHFIVLILLIAHNISPSSERIRIIDYLKEKAPNLHFDNGIKQKSVSLVYNTWPHFFIRLRFLYGKIWEDCIIPFYHHKIKRKKRKN